jgi:hypothetical protein
MEESNYYKIFDDRFTVDVIEKHDLVIEFSITRLKFFIKSTKPIQIIWLEDHFLGLENTIEQAVEKSKEIIESHDFVSANFWNSIKIVANSPFFCLVPSELFNENLAPNYMYIAFPKIKKENFTIQSKPITNLDAQLVFAYPTAYLDLFAEIYQEKELKISYSVLEIVNHYNGKLEAKNRNIIVFEDKFLVLIYKSKLSKKIRIEILPNQSKFFENFLKLYLKDGQIKTVVYGEITIFSKWYEILKKQGKAIEIGSKNTEINLTQFFSETPDHRYWSLFLY